MRGLLPYFIAPAHCGHADCCSNSLTCCRFVRVWHSQQGAHAPVRVALMPEAPFFLLFLTTNKPPGTCLPTCRVEDQTTTRRPSSGHAGLVPGNPRSRNTGSEHPTKFEPPTTPATHPRRRVAKRTTVVLRLLPPPLSLFLLLARGHGKAIQPRGRRAGPRRQPGHGTMWQWDEGNGRRGQSSGASRPNGYASGCFVGGN